MKARADHHLNARQRANAELCGLPLTEYLALPRRERKRRVRAAREEADRG